MEKTSWIISYKLKEGVTNEQFIEGTKKLHDNYISKASVFLFWEQYLDKDTWFDFVMWETKDYAKKGVHAGSGTEESRIFYSMIKMETCIANMSSSLIKRY